MQLPKQSIESVCSNEVSRYTLQGVLLDTKKNLLVATNGHALAAIPAKPCPGDQTGIISLRGWKLARAAAKRIPRKLRSKVAGSIQILKHRIILRGVDETTVLPKMTGQFPIWQGLFADLKPKTQVTLNVDLLAQLAEALCEPGLPPMVTLFIEAPDKAFGVVAERGEGIGVMMPCRSGNDSSSIQRRAAEMGIKRESK